MMVFAIGVERTDDVSVQGRMAPIRANIVGPFSLTTSIRASIASCHSGASCFALGSLVM